MSKKVRIHDLAKRYGMPGKDLASKLRDYGFTKARTHMSALDDFELVQAEGLLQANGITPVAIVEDAPSEDVPKSTLLKRKVKRKAPAAEPVAEASAPVEVPVLDPQPQAAAPVPEVEAVPAEILTPVAEPEVAQAPVEVEVTPEPVAEATPDVTPDVTPEVEPTPEPVAQAAPEAPVTDPAPATVQEAASVEVAPEVQAPEPEAGPEPEAEAPKEQATPETVPTAEAKPEAAPTPEAAEAPKAEEAKDKEEPKGKKAVVVNPKGNVIGFIDPSTFQKQNAPRGRHQTRRLVGRDDVTPDVRPSGGRGPREKAGPRGALTATQLREREQGRFLRRSGPRGRGGSRRGGRGARGPRVEVTESPLSGSTVVIETPITVAKLSEALKLKSSVVQKMAMEKQYGMFTLNASLDEDTATLLAGEYDVELDVRESKSAEDVHLEEFIQQRSAVEDSELVDRAPTIAVLGHVDHGKTTLVDYLRSTKVADGEAGGITQHMGAYQITAEGGKKITILDTPGHAAFTAMRARGAKAVDVVVLVVAGDDGVKPSTEEAVNHAKAAGTPIVVAINKSDKPNFNANTVIQQLMGFELVPEQYGGNTAMFEISALKGTGIKELIQHLILMGEAELGLKAHPKGSASGVVLEAEIQQGRGIVAHLLVQDGSLAKGNILLAGEGYGRIKSIQDDVGKIIKSAGPATPVAVTGLDALPGVGDTFYIVDSLAQAKQIASDRAYENRAKVLAASTTPRKDLEAMLGRSGPEKTIINLIVRADVQGSLEAIRYEVAKLVHEEVEFKIVHSGVGPITESDVSLGITSEAILMAFQVGVAGKVRKEAERNHLSIRRYTVIYELLDELRDLMEGALAPDLEEEVTGHVEIRRIFRSSKIGSIAGCIVLDGIVNRNSKVRLLRDENIIYTGEIGSLKREAQDAGEVREGFECGILLKNYGDLKEGDIIETFAVKEIKRKLEI